MNRCPNCKSFITVLTRAYNENGFPNKRRCLDCGHIFIVQNNDFEEERLQYNTHRE